MIGNEGNAWGRVSTEGPVHHAPTLPRAEHLVLEALLGVAEGEDVAVERGAGGGVGARLDDGRVVLDLAEYGPVLADRDDVGDVAVVPLFSAY